MKWKKRDVIYDAWQVPPGHVSPGVASPTYPSWMAAALELPYWEQGSINMLYRLCAGQRFFTGYGVHNESNSSIAESGDWIVKAFDGKLNVWEASVFDLWFEPDQPYAEGAVPRGREMTEKEKKAARHFLDTGCTGVESDPRSHTAKSDGADGSTCDWCACEDRDRCDEADGDSPLPPPVAVGDASLAVWQTGGAVRFVCWVGSSTAQVPSLSTLLSIDDAIMLASQLKDAARHATSRIDGERIE